MFCAAPLLITADTAQDEELDFPKPYVHFLKTQGNGRTWGSYVRTKTLFSSPCPNKRDQHFRPYTAYELTQVFCLARFLWMLLKIKLKLKPTASADKILHTAWLNSLLKRNIYTEEILIHLFTFSIFQFIFLSETEINPA